MPLLKKLKEKILGLDANKLSEETNNESGPSDRT